MPILRVPAAPVEVPGLRVEPEAMMTFPTMQVAMPSTVPDRVAVEATVTLPEGSREPVTLRVPAEIAVFPV